MTYRTQVITPIYGTSVHCKTVERKDHPDESARAQGVRCEARRPAQASIRHWAQPRSKKSGTHEIRHLYRSQPPGRIRQLLSSHHQGAVTQLIPER